MNLENTKIYKIHTLYFRLILAYSLFVISWVLFIGSAITFANYKVNMFHPLTEGLIEPWKILRNIGLLLATPSWVISLGILMFSFKHKIIAGGIKVCLQWFFVHALLLFSYAISYILLSFILLMMVNKG